MTVTPKPCPFCGKDPDPQILEPHSHAVTFGGFKMPDYPGGATVECDCGAGLIDDSLEVVVARWNTRAADASLADAQAEIARLRGALVEAHAFIENVISVAEPGLLEHLSEYKTVERMCADALK